MNDGVDFGHMNLEDYGPTDRERPFHDIIDVLGPMTHVEPVSRAEADRYRGRVPDGLLDFWVEHGRGAFLQGYLWLCDPELLRPVVEATFANDPEYDAEDFTCYLYRYDGEVDAWSSRDQNCTLDLTGFDQTKVFVHGPGPIRDLQYGSMSPDFFVAHSMRTYRGELALRMDEDYSDHHLFTSAANRLGRLEPGEIFGFFPSRQMGGEGYPEDMRKVKLVEHLLFHLQLAAPTLMGWEPIDGTDFNRPVPIRKLGPQGG